MPRISFGMIALNAEPFTRYNLRALYPVAHQILVVEGATLPARSIARTDGHSRDGTLEALRAFQAEEDPDRKVTVVTAEDEGYADGFWPGEKDEMSAVYASRATGDWLWQVDADEFYRNEHFQEIGETLQADPAITACSFRQLQFWGGFDSTVDSWYLRRGGDVFHRLFRWGKGYRYVSHRPPTVHDAEGRDVRRQRWVGPRTWARRGIFVYHYSLVFPRQVSEKCRYYDATPRVPGNEYSRWMREVFETLRDPLHAHNVYVTPGWLLPFRGRHPQAVDALRRDLASGLLVEEQRRSDDIARLLGSPRYRLQCAALRCLDYPDRVRQRCARTLAARAPGLYRAVRAMWRSVGKG
jgi:hypothetical protein